MRSHSWSPAIYRRGITLICAAVASVGLLIPVASPAHASTCTLDFREPLPDVSFPCPGDSDLPSLNVMVQTTYGPIGYYDCLNDRNPVDGGGWTCTGSWGYPFRIQQYSHIYFVNIGPARTDVGPIGVDSGRSDGKHQFSGAGFDSGLVPVGGFSDVSGVPGLSPGKYDIYDDGEWAGYFYVDAPKPPFVV
jgi:hypothetical protein